MQLLYARQIQYFVLIVQTRGSYIAVKLVASYYVCS